MPLFAILIGYVALAGGLLAFTTPNTAWRVTAFAVINVAMFGALLVAVYAMRAPAVAGYLACIVAHYVLLRWARRSQRFWLPMVFPVLVMLVTKVHDAFALVGISYLAFRLSYLALEVKDGRIPMPEFARYMAYACFPPLLAVGPITTMRVFNASLDTPDRTATPVGIAAQRIVLGLLKFKVFAPLLFTLTPKVLLLDNYQHGWCDFLLGSAVYYWYLYCDFSGYTDLVIGIAGLLGIAVEENFDQPYRARNLQEFWQRWHITLARYMRDMVYLPLVKAGSRRWGREGYDRAVLLAIFVTFTLTGLWHGLARNYLFYGMLHALGLITHYLYTALLRKRLGARIAAYNANPLARWTATAITHVYLCFTFVFFASDMSTLKTMLAALR